MNLGKFIDTLERLHQKDWLWIARSPVMLRPVGLDSYRGHYCDLAFKVETGRSQTEVASILTEAKAALDRTFTGYKGGTYRMGLDTRLWISNYGEASGALVTGIREIAGVGAWEITWRKDDEE